jgi:hypothetical protein
MLFSFLPTFLNSDIIILFVLVLNEYNILIFPQQFCAFVYIYIHDLFIMFNVFFFIFVVFNVFPLACSYYCVFFCGVC